MKIYHIEFAKAGVNLSGGEVCMLELIKCYSDMGYENILLTTDNGEAAYRQNLPEDISIEYRTINSYAVEKKFGVIISYLYRTFLAVNMARRLKDMNHDDMLICHSEFFPNSIPNRLLLNKNEKVKSIAFFHMKAPRIMYGYEGEYTNKRQFPRPTIIHYKLNQILYRKLMTPQSKIVTVNNFYKNFLNEEYPDNDIVVLKSYGGSISEHTKVLPGVQDMPKDFDLIWVGRFHRQKGLLDFIDMVSLLVKMMPDIRIVILGDGENEIKSKADDKIKTYSLQKNITLAGFITGEDKHRFYEKSKVFAITSNYESFGMVILEAMAHTLPVVAYKLPVYDVFNSAMVGVPVLDNKLLAEVIVKLLKDSDYYRQQSELSYNESKKHSWVKTAKDILNIYV